MSGMAFLTGKELKKAVETFAERARSWTEYVAVVGSSCVKHAAEHGDTGYLNAFFAALPNNYTRPFMAWLHANGVHEWLMARNGEFSIKKSEEAKKKREEFNERFTSPEDWTAFQVKRQTDFDLDAVKRRLSSLKKNIEDHGVEVPEEVMQGIGMALAALQ